MPLMLESHFADHLPDFGTPCLPSPASAPEMLCFNAGLAHTLGITAPPATLLPYFSGNAVLKHSKPLAQVYAGHQFGRFVPQLGDGRAVLLGEIKAPNGALWDLVLKGAGRTPYARNGDGRAAKGPVLREYLMGEAMHALGVPSTRALAAVATGDWVHREGPKPGAILVRVAQSHLRVGTFAFFAARDDHPRLQRLVDYALLRHPSLRDAFSPHSSGPPDELQEAPALRLLKAVVARQAHLVAHWMSVGFIHGVMNTDNTAISGETLDFGPCAWMENYDPQTVYSSIDQLGRYAYQNQAGIAQWNLARLAECLLPLIHADENTALAHASEAVGDFADLYHQARLSWGRRKLGLQSTPANDEALLGDEGLLNDWLALLQTHSADYTLAWRYLAQHLRGEPQPLAQALPDTPALQAWLGRWFMRLSARGGTPPSPEQCADLARAMDAVNPIHIPRNHRVEEALWAATVQSNLEPFERLLAVVQDPYGLQGVDAHFATPANTAFNLSYRTFCGT